MKFIKMKKKISTSEKARREYDKLVNSKCYKKAIEHLSRHRIKDVTITKSRAKAIYNLKEADFNKLKFIEVDNPYYKCAACMKLYMIKEIEDKFSSTISIEEKNNINQLTLN